jgi:hypothetical protein
MRLAERRLPVAFSCRSGRNSKAGPILNPEKAPPAEPRRRPGSPSSPRSHLRRRSFMALCVTVSAGHSCARSRRCCGPSQKHLQAPGTRGGPRMRSPDRPAPPTQQGPKRGERRTLRFSRAGPALITNRSERPVHSAEQPANPARPPWTPVFSRRPRPWSITRLPVTALSRLGLKNSASTSP